MTRLDAALVERGIARSRGQARELVLAGRVRVDGRIVDRPAHPVADPAVVHLDGEPDRYVSRAAHKLLAALDTFAVEVKGRRCIDVGASTGGFTQVLLERGAHHVVALDVGHGQLSPSLARDPRVTDASGTTVRGLDPAAVGGPFDLLVTDLSFISLTLVAFELRSLVTDAADLVVLVKPQFEVGRGGLGKGGVVREASARADAVERVLAALSDAQLTPLALAPSPVTGTDGNVEVLVHASARTLPVSASPVSRADVERACEGTAEQVRP